MMVKGNRTALRTHHSSIVDAYSFCSGISDQQNGCLETVALDT
ncbi:hypothetical protein SynPROS91_02540 [Synechococcus sp. PROS-9-1]|nr:hypothetical protein SynPROS91_02540 [Synechococcus sp. PROS-9-1]